MELTPSPPPGLPPVGVVGADACALLAAGLAVTEGVPDGGVVVLGSSAASRARLAAEAVASGCHVFLAWPPSVSADESAALARRAEEAGVEVGVARPLPLSGLLGGRPAGWAARLVTLALDVPAERAADLPWGHRLAAALDAGATLAGSHELARVDAAWAHTDGRPTALAAALRFQNGAFAQLALRLDAPADGFSLYAAGSGVRVEARAPGGPLCVDGAPPALPRPPEDEAVAFVLAVAAGRAAPFPLRDALATMRLAERVMERLR